MAALGGSDAWFWIVSSTGLANGWHHVVAVLGIELERLRVDNERNLRLGSELLDDLLQQRLPAHQAQQRLITDSCQQNPGDEFWSLRVPTAEPALGSAGVVIVGW